MRKGMWSAAALVLLLSGAVFLIGPTVQAAETVTMGSSSDPNAFKFFPPEITVPVGSTVVWRNLSDIPHDATARDKSFVSPQLTKGQDFSFTFKTPGEVQYYCSVSGHEDAGMKGVVKVTGGGTPTTVATTPTTQGGSTATTRTTAAGQAPTTTTTTAKAAAGASSSTTTTAAGNATTTTTLAPAGAPASAPETAGETTTTTAAHGGGEEAAADQGGEGEGHEKKEKKKNSPIGIAFASVSTLLLAAIAGKLLASKS